MQPKRILLVDDEDHIRKLMKKVLTMMNHNVIAEAKNGQDGFKLYKELKPDVILMDINMPVMTGDEALEQIIKYDPSAVVIMLTSVSDMESIQHCLELGASNYLRKDTPINQIQISLKDTFDYDDN